MTDPKRSHVVDAPKSAAWNGSHPPPAAPFDHDARIFEWSRESAFAPHTRNVNGQIEVRADGSLLVRPEADLVGDISAVNARVMARAILGPDDKLGEAREERDAAVSALEAERNEGVALRNCLQRALDDYYQEHSDWIKDAGVLLGRPVQGGLIQQLKGLLEAEKGAHGVTRAKCEGPMRAYAKRLESELASEKVDHQLRRVACAAIESERKDAWNRVMKLESELAAEKTHARSGWTASDDYFKLWKATESELAEAKAVLAKANEANVAVSRIVRRVLACGQLEKLDDARPYLTGAEPWPSATRTDDHDSASKTGGK